MVILIAGESHTGKTLLAQKLLEAYRYPCLSLDHLKMGLIRSGQCALSPESDDAELTRYLWPIVREMIKTCIENRQNMIIEGCYIPLAGKMISRTSTEKKSPMSASCSARATSKNDMRT